MRYDESSPGFTRSKIQSNDYIYKETDDSFHRRDWRSKHDPGQSAIDRLQPLVETSARRLVLAREVALAKWDSGLSVEDPTREAQVIMAAAKDGESKGLNRTFVSSFFAAQIDANKLVQYSLLAEWHRAGRAPKHPPVSLTEDIRPRLDQIEGALIAELVKTEDIRTNASCQDNTAKAVSKYLAHRHLGKLLAIALDWAMEPTAAVLLRARRLNVQTASRLPAGSE